MGLFSIHAGILYNDVFSKSVNIFGSSWTSNYNESTILNNSVLVFDPAVDYNQIPYAFGLDPVWQVGRCVKLANLRSKFRY